MGYLMHKELAQKRNLLRARKTNALKYKIITACQTPWHVDDLHGPADGVKDVTPGGSQRATGKGLI